MKASLSEIEKRLSSFATVQLKHETFHALADLDMFALGYLTNDSLGSLAHQSAH